MRLRTVGVSVAGLLSVWLTFVAVLLSPRAQVALVTLHWVHWPLFAEFAAPERYGFAAGRVRHFYLETPDGARLGAWLVLADSPFARLRRKRRVVPLSAADYDTALRDRPTVLYLHGNAATRAAAVRTQVLRYLMTLDANVMIIDYRGFADSSRELPTEHGLCIDARAAWDWLAGAFGAPRCDLTEAARTEPSNIVVMAQSLGTGIATQLVGGQLAREGVVPRALVLVAPFTSIAELLSTYKVRRSAVPALIGQLGKYIPVMSPFARLPGFQAVLHRFLTYRFESKRLVSAVRSPILLVHAQDDADIQHTHSRSLMRTLSGSSTPTTQRLGQFGTVSRVKRVSVGGQTFGDVIHLELALGGHNSVGWADETMILMHELLQ